MKKAVLLFASILRLMCGIARAENPISSLKMDLNVFKDYNWKNSMGGAVLLYEGDLKLEGNTMISESPHKYISLNAVYPDPIIGLAGCVNLKKLGGDIWFGCVTRLDEKIRKDLEERFGFLKFIRIDVGGYYGLDVKKGGRTGGWVFKAVEWEF